MASPETSPQLSKKFERAGVFTLGLVLALLPLFFWVDTRDQFELPKVVLMRLLSILLLGAYALQLATSPRWSFRRTPLDLPVLAWSLWLIVKTVWSVAPAISWRGEYENFTGSLTQLNYSLLYFAAVQLVRSLRRARLLLLAFEMSTLLVGIYAVFQSFGLDFITWSAASITQGRYFASMGNPNFLGALMVMGLALLGARARWPAKDALLRHRPGIRNLGLLLEGLVLLKALSATATRGAFAGAIAVLLFFALLFEEEIRVRTARRGLVILVSLFSVAAALGLGSLALGPGMRQRMAYTLTHPAKAFEESRMQIWKPAFRIAAAYPLSGAGVDTFKSVFPQYASAQFAKYDGENVSSRTAHSEPLQILATLGAIGSALWVWLLLALGLGWRAAWRGAGRAEDPDRSMLLAGLAGLWIGYLVQNLVSFGVTAITAPFFLSMGLLWSVGGSREIVVERAPNWAKGLLGVLTLALFAWGLPAAISTFRADKLYNFGHQASSQMSRLDSMPLEDVRGAAGYALNQLQGDSKRLTPEDLEEGGFWFARLQPAEKELEASHDPATQQRLLPVYRGAADSLMLLLSSWRQRQAVALCPGEVKYRVYLGLAYEELFQRSVVPKLRDHWFSLAEAQYVESCRLNPRNAYYQANLGRLYAMRASVEQGDWLAKSEARYLAALRLAPVTRLFYEDLLMIYASTGREAEAFALIQPLEAQSPGLSRDLYAILASQLDQAAQKLGDAHQKEKAAQLRAAAQQARERAASLHPSN